MAGKTPKSKGKKMSHGNSHASSEDVKWDESNRKWIWVGKRQENYGGMFKSRLRKSTVWM